MSERLEASLQRRRSRVKGSISSEAHGSPEAGAQERPLGKKEFSEFWLPANRVIQAYPPLGCQNHGVTQAYPPLGCQNSRSEISVTQTREAEKGEERSLSGVMFEGRVNGRIPLSDSFSLEYQRIALMIPYGSLCWEKIVRGKNNLYDPDARQNSPSAP